MTSGRNPRPVEPAVLDVCSMIPGAVWPAVPTARASQLLAIQFQLERSQWYAPDEILRQQKRQLWPLYCHAYERVPLYRGRMDAAGNGYDFAVKQEVTDQAELPGQGNNNPASLFNNHQFVVFLVGGTLKYFDPSYGVQYSGEADFDSKLSGFFRKLTATSNCEIKVAMNPDGNSVLFFTSDAQ